MASGEVESVLLRGLRGRKEKRDRRGELPSKGIVVTGDAERNGFRKDEGVSLDARRETRGFDGVEGTCPLA